MIKGANRSGDFRFHEEFSAFLQLVNQATVTHKSETVTLNGKRKTENETRFNLQSTVTRYQSTLASKFTHSCDEIEALLDESYLKTEKIYILARHTVEIESLHKLLAFNNTIGFSHKRFVVSNISEGKRIHKIMLSEKDFQDYYYWMNHYLQKMSSFLIQLTSAVQAIPQSEFPVSSAMLSDPNGSSMEKPIGFFEFLFLKDGIRQLRKKFIPSDEDYFYADISYNHKTETITSRQQDNETGEWEEFKTSFKDDYIKRLFVEFKLSRVYIDEHIDLLRTESEVRLFVSIMLTRLNYLLKIISDDPEAGRYESSPGPLKALIKYIYDKYEMYCPPNYKVPEGILIADNKQIETPSSQKMLQSTSKGVSVFKVKNANLDGFVLFLYQYLIEGKIISESTDIDSLKNAFDGTHRDTPLKIRWIDKGKNGLINKHTLFYLLNRLAAENIIYEDGDNNLLYRRINIVFADENGEALKHLPESNATSAKNRKIDTPSKKTIDQMITAIKSAVMSQNKS